MRDRIPVDPGRVKMTRSDGTFEYVTIERADNPTQEGTPLNKALLDYAVAACGVTAGTSTAYTLDGELVDGFTLTDGAKVNFRLHVASGANPTLNVNGTGAKALVDANGAPPPGEMAAGTWIMATYSLVDDAYTLSNVTHSTWIATTASDSQDISISLPEGCSIYHLTARLNLDNEYGDYVLINVGTTCEFFSYGVRWSTTELKRIAESGTSMIMNTGVTLDPKGGVLDLWIVRDDNYSRLSGLIHTARGIVSFCTQSIPAKINAVHIVCEDYYITAGATIILEGIA